MTLAALLVSLMVVVALLTALDAPLLDAGLLAGLMILLPGLGLAQARGTRQLTDAERIPAYASSALAISALGDSPCW